MRQRSSKGAQVQGPASSPQPQLVQGGSSSKSSPQEEMEPLIAGWCRVPAVRLLLRLPAWLVFPHGSRSPSSTPSDYTSSTGDDGEEELDSQAKEKRMKDLARDVVEEEKRFKFALLSTTILLFTLFNILFFLCPGVEFTPALAFSPSPSEELIPPAESDSGPTFRRVITTLAIINCATFALHHLLRSITFSACAVFIYLNGSVWLICIMWGPVSELLGALVHVPVLAFYVFGHRSGATALVTTLVQAVLYMVACLVRVVPASGNTLKLGLTAQVMAIMSAYILLGLCAALNERSRAQAVRMYQEAHARLVKATKAKARFLANVSHELRTPLHGIVAASEELMERVATECPTESQPAVREMCKIVTESSRHMLALINDVLDFEQLDTNQLKIENIPFDLRQELTKLVKMLEPTARQKKIALTYRLAVEHCRRLGDPLRFGQVLVNLAANALKFTPEGGSVNISVTTGRCGEVSGEVPCRPSKNPQQLPKPPPPGDQSAGESPATGSSSSGHAEAKTNEDGNSDDEGGTLWDDTDDESVVTVVVQDSGIGIPEDHIPLLFKSFTQADISTTRKFGGSGLGLAICKRLCQLMHGRIGCHSRDQGSTFWFALPLPLAPDEEKAGSPPARTDERTAAERELLRGLRVLLVEDHKVNQLIGKQMLARAGCGEVVVAANGEQGVLAWEQQGPFHIVLMDYHMPVMDGLEATRRIRQREQELGSATRTPIIAISASLEPKDRARGATAGMDDWLEKPFDRRILTAMILRWARRQAPT